jgi:hypothetical protein
MKRILILLLISFLSRDIYTQDLYLCKSYTEQGKPVEVYNRLEIKPWGTAIYILVDNNGRAFNESVLYIFIDKLRDDKYQPYESRVINIENDNSWAVTGFEFKDPGEYDIYCLEGRKKKLVSKKINVILSSDFSTSAIPTSYRYYENCKFSFCEAIIEGKPVNVFRTLKIKSSNDFFYVYLNNDKPLKTDKIIVQIWRMKPEEEDYNEFIATKYFKIDFTWPDVFFKYSLADPGDYRFDIYNENEVLIAKNFIKITH